jgi:hypothetical protein
MARMYCQWVGIILLVLGIIGFMTPMLLTLQFTALHNWIHLISGAVLAYLGFTGSAVKTGAQVFGVVYTLVAVLGFLGGGVVPILGLPVNALYNLIHLVVGLAGVYAGFSAPEASSSKA